jgi:hypothetical protein
MIKLEKFLAKAKKKRARFNAMPNNSMDVRAKQFLLVSESILFGELFTSNSAFQDSGNALRSKVGYLVSQSKSTDLYNRIKLFITNFLCRRGFARAYTTNQI